MRGVVPIGYATFAVALGVVAGAVLRRSVAAMALTLALVAFAQIAMPLWVRPHLIGASTETVTVTPDIVASFILHADTGKVEIIAQTPSRDDWLLSHGFVDAQGHAVAVPSYVDSCITVGPSGQSEEQAGDEARTQVAGCLARLAADGYRQRIVFVPAGRFWSLQVRELGLFVLLTVALCGVSLRRVRRV